ncbi:MAG: type II toxin-antitoxin system VapC family toxin [Candidatus Micrarchaeota archaeon]
MKVLDTDFLVALLRGSEQAKTLLDELRCEDVSTTSISAFELNYGALKTKNPENIAVTKRLLSSLDVMPLDKLAAEKTAEIINTLQSRGENLDLRDAMIAGITASNAAAIVTRNTKHFSKVKELEVIRW